jgi:hypothetical protein
MAKKDKKLWIDMCAGSELKDTQGETLSVDGADIHELEMGKGRFNDNHGKGFFNSLGRVTEAKKIFKAEDCSDDRQKYYWEKIKAPYIYAKGYLYNDEDHPNAKAAAAIIRNIHREDAPLAMKASVEGGVISRGIKDPTRLARTKIHSVALTFTPANNATLVEPLSIDKSDSDWEADKQLIKSVMHLAETNVPSFRHIERHASANTIHENIQKIQELAKSLGIDIEIKESCPNMIMKNAVYHKLFSNVQKINDLVKAVSSKGMMNVMKPHTNEVSEQPTEQEAYRAKLSPGDKYQQDIGRMRQSSSIPTTPKDLNQSPNIKTKSGAQLKSQNVIKRHASKAMRDPEHLNAVHKELTSRGIHPEKIAAIIGKIKSHTVKKSDDMEKGEIADAAKKMIIAGAMAVGAESMTDKPSSVKRAPAEESKTSKQAMIAAHNRKVRDPDLLIAPQEQDYDPRIPGSKEKWLHRRTKEEEEADKAKVQERLDQIKGRLKKALTAGYGGAGAPTNLTGGGVFQPESVEGSRKSETSDGITYISCDQCGHEQAYMEHQVKCRGCNKNFSLDKLKGHI